MFPPSSSRLTNPCVRAGAPSLCREDYVSDVPVGPSRHIMDRGPHLASRFGSLAGGAAVCLGVRGRRRRKKRERGPPNFRVENHRENTTDLGGSREPCPSCKTPGKGHFSDRSSYLVDPASSHMLVSKIKPCMSKYKLVSSETADGSLNQLWFIGSSPPDMDNCGNSRANTCVQAPTFQKACFY